MLKFICIPYKIFNICNYLLRINDEDEALIDSKIKYYSFKLN